jgi:hypothetical protein
MISPLAARRIAIAHKWLGLVVGVQLLVWTATGLFFTLFPISDIRGDRLWSASEDSVVDLSAVRVTPQEALSSVVEDRPVSVTLRSLAGTPVYEIRAEIGSFLVSAETAEVLSPISEEQARAIASVSWLGSEEPSRMEFVEAPPREAGGTGPMWAAHFEGSGRPVLYVNAVSGRPGPVRTDLWRTYDLLWSLHIMDYRSRESFNHPLIVAAAVLALSTSLFGIALLAHRFTRGRFMKKGNTPA